MKERAACVRPAQFVICLVKIVAEGLSQKPDGQVPFGR
jgi:hypothetical protein